MSRNHLRVLESGQQGIKLRSCAVPKANAQIGISELKRKRGSSRLGCSYPNAGSTESASQPSTARSEVSAAAAAASTASPTRKRHRSRRPLWLLICSELPRSTQRRVQPPDPQARCSTKTSSLLRPRFPRRAPVSDTGVVVSALMTFCQAIAGHATPNTCSCRSSGCWRSSTIAAYSYQEIRSASPSSPRNSLGPHKNFMHSMFASAR